jgi:alpha,alpha-trehalase
MSKETAGVSVEQISEYIRSHWDDSVRSGVTSPNVEPIPHAHTTPCIDGHFIALFYWDTYFANIGLLLQDRVELARSNCDAMIYLVNKKGFMPNSTFLGDDTRSQPPYLSLMVREVYEKSGDRAWLESAVQALETEYSFWMEKRITPIGLNRHFHHADEEYLLNFYKGALVGRLKKRPNLPREEQLYIAANYLGEAETGWDFNPRFAGRCGEFAPVDLNSNLYLYETNFAWFMRE